jgi:hypothetical protein
MKLITIIVIKITKPKATVNQQLRDSPYQMNLDTQINLKIFINLYWKPYPNSTFQTRSSAKSDRNY